MTHLTVEQRYALSALRQAGQHNGAEIARCIGVHKSTVGREIKRNGRIRVYHAQEAQERYIQRRRSRGAYVLDAHMRGEINSDLKQQWSPEQISARRKQAGKPGVSHETIYQYVYTEKRHGGTLYTNLRNGHRKRKRRLNKKDNRGIIPNRVMIDRRPKIVEQKMRIGDWEGDTIIGANHQGAILTLTERRTKMLLTKKLYSKNARKTANAVISLLRNSDMPAHTITFDNGKEFAEHQYIARRLNTKVYFANPYHSWERGLNENTNGLLRQYIPKKQNFEYVSCSQLKKYQHLINNRPRKTLKYLTPIEFLTKKLTLKKVAFQT